MVVLTNVPNGSFLGHLIGCAGYDLDNPYTMSKDIAGNIAPDNNHVSNTPLFSY